MLSRMPYWLKGFIIGIALSLPLGALISVPLLYSDPFPFLGGSNEFVLSSFLRFFASSAFLFVILLPVTMLGTFLGVVIGFLKRENKIISLSTLVALGIVMATTVLSGFYFGIF